MEGLIAKCLEELVRDKYGTTHWREILTRSGVDPRMRASLIPEAMLPVVVKNTAEVLGLSPMQIGDAFREYWANTFAPKAAQMMLLRLHPQRRQRHRRPLVMH